MEKRWVIYDFVNDELASSVAYPSYGEALADANEIDNCIVICLGEVAPSPDPEEYICCIKRGLKIQMEDVPEDLADDECLCNKCYEEDNN